MTDDPLVTLRDALLNWQATGAVERWPALIYDCIAEQRDELAALRARLDQMTAAKEPEIPARFLAGAGVFPPKPAPAAGNRELPPYGDPAKYWGLCADTDCNQPLCSGLRTFGSAMARISKPAPAADASEGGERDTLTADPNCSRCKGSGVVSGILCPRCFAGLHVVDDRQRYEIEQLRAALATSRAECEELRTLAARLGPSRIDFARERKRAEKAEAERDAEAAKRRELEREVKELRDEKALDQARAARDIVWSELATAQARLDDVASALHPHWPEGSRKTYQAEQLADRARGMIAERDERMRELSAVRARLELAERVVETVRRIHYVSPGRMGCKLCEALEAYDAVPK
jgi:hypothetical protein